MSNWIDKSVNSCWLIEYFILVMKGMWKYCYWLYEGNIFVGPKDGKWCWRKHFLCADPYVAQISCQRCFVIPFTIDISIILVATSHSCRTSIYYLHSAETWQLMISCDLAVQQFFCWTSRLVNIEFVKPVDKHPFLLDFLLIRTI